MTIAQLTVKWDKLTGLPGYSFFYVRSTAASISPIPTFLDAIKQFFPVPLEWTVSPFWKLIDETNGKATGAGGGGPEPKIAATGGTAYAPQSGVQIKWDSGEFVNGRRVKGRTYLVPTVNTRWMAGGVADPVMTNTINAAADVMRQAYTGNLVVWARPLFELDADGHPTEVLKRPGSIHTVLTTTCPTKSVTLNARRDA